MILTHVARHNARSKNGLYRNGRRAMYRLFDGGDVIGWPGEALKRCHLLENVCCDKSFGEALGINGKLIARDADRIGQRKLAQTVSLRTSEGRRKWDAATADEKRGQTAKCPLE